MNKKYWIFDLDNTLYASSSGIFDEIDRRMKKFISNEFGISEKNSLSLQKKLYKKYGTTLYGLIKYYKINPIKFLDYVHDINLCKIEQSDFLKEYLNNLPGKKIIFTNGDAKWAKKILSALGIKNSFDGIFDIIKANYIPKPQKETYTNFIKNFDIDPSKSVFFEDTERNLEHAYKLGITTILIDEELKNKDAINSKKFIDFRFKCIQTALKKINNIKFNNH